MSESTFTGPGEVMLAPETWGDIVPIQLDGQTNWSVGRDAFLACTGGVSRATKSQGLGKALCEYSCCPALRVQLPAHRFWILMMP